MPVFPFAFETRFKPLVWASAGATPDNSRVRLEDGRFTAEFGRLRCSTKIENIAGCEVSGPYRWYRAIGPRMSFTDRGATYGSTTEGGVCIRFHRPVKALAGSLVLHPGLTVTVEDRQGLVDAIEAARSSG